MISLALAAIMFLILSFWVNQLLVKILPKYIYLIVLFPGIVLHELAHFLCAILTGTPVSEVKFFSATGGHVIHAKPRIPVVGQLIISFAPLAIGIVAVFFLCKLIPIAISYPWSIPYLSIPVPVPELLAGFHFIYILWIYLILSITLTLLPSKQDVLAALAGIIVTIFVIVLIYYNDWLKIPTEISGYLWYIDISMMLVVFILIPIQTVAKRR